MSAGMAEVIAEHSVTDSGLTEDSDVYWRCYCGTLYVTALTQVREHIYDHATHVAEELAKAGYGDVREAFGAAADELARLPYVKPGDEGRDDYERMLAIRRGDTDKWLREKAAAHGVD